MIALFFFLQGCVGAGIYAPSEHDEYWRAMMPRTSVVLNRDEQDQSRVFSLDYYSAARVHNKSDVIRHWGEPDRILDVDGQAVWVYRGGEHVWAGLAIQLMATIPLAIPIGRNYYHLYFKDDVLEKVRHRTFSTYLFVCDPFYGFVHAWGVGMSSTGGYGGSSIGLCTGIKRPGFYNHYITNW
ncbi:hypothetical protein [Pseudomonas sp. B392_1p]|uniref:hypothetical protein n=1 Tax=Pseudomonas sp. B392_1p TaxID=3457507 RepID=UPI003FD3C96A